MLFFVECMVQLSAQIFGSDQAGKGLLCTCKSASVPRCGPTASGGVTWNKESGNGMNTHWWNVDCKQVNTKGEEQVGYKGNVFESTGTQEAAVYASIPLHGTVSVQ